MPRRVRMRPPPHIRAALSLESGERPLAWAQGHLGEWYVGTGRALHLPGRGSGGGPGPEPAEMPRDGEYRAVPWERIAHADWHSDTDQLVVVEVAEWGESEPRTQVTIAEPGRLLELLRERITKSVVCTVFAPVRGRLGLSVVGRRSPVGSGPISWSYLLSDGLDPADPLVTETAERTLSRARAEVAGL